MSPIANNNGNPRDIRVLPGRGSYGDNFKGQGAGFLNNDHGYINYFNKEVNNSSLPQGVQAMKKTGEPRLHK
jgi:hypothetical protein